MKLIKKVCKPTSIFLAIVFFMFPAFHQTASAAMVGTELMLTANRHPDTRGYLRALLSRKEIQRELVFHGIDLETGHGQAIGKLVSGQVKINVLLEPVQGDFHTSSPLSDKSM